MQFLPFIVGSLLPIAALSSAVPAAADPPCTPGTPSCRADTKRSVDPPCVPGTPDCHPMVARSAATPAPKPKKCYHDNLFRDFKRFKAYEFCSAFEADPTTTIPKSLHIHKTYTPQQISSACACIGPAPSKCPINGCFDGSGLIQESTVAQAQDCAKLCSGTPSCLSYQIGPNGNGINCNLLSKAAADEWYKEDPVQPYCAQYNIYDKDCPVPTTCAACSSSSSSDSA